MSRKSVFEANPNLGIAEFATQKIQEIKDKVGNGKALCALSGGVDSSVAAVLVNKAIGENLTCIFVDTGLMRHNEGDEVEEIFSGIYSANFVRVNAKDRFLAKLKGVTDPEEKRKIIGEEFIRVFEEEAKKIGAVDYFVQGTIFTDIAESGVGADALIKSHHNVGGLPDVIDFKEIIEPLRDLYKDEVRKVGTELGIPANLVNRQPFPGPGLGVRCLGEITEEKLEIIRLSDYIFREELEKRGLNKQVWQYFTVLPNVNTVGVKNKARTYGHLVALRAVESKDAVTAQWAHLPYELLGVVSERITSEIAAVNRVVLDVTNKPSGTIEWE